MLNAILQAARRVIAPRPNIEVENAINELREERMKLQTAKNQLGGDVWHMVETGDPLAALVHSARTAQFHAHIASEPE